MSDKIRIAIDAMGGDNAPGEIVKGAVDAVQKGEDDFRIFLVGNQAAIRTELDRYSFPQDRISIVPASEVIETAEPPVAAIRAKKDSSLVVGLTMVRNQ